MEWKPIETYDSLKEKPALAVFWFKEVKPSQQGGLALSACANLSRIMGFRECTHWMPLPAAPQQIDKGG